MYHQRHTFFLSQLNILLTKEYIFLTSEDNWPCITFEALSIREKLSLFFSVFFTFAVSLMPAFDRAEKQIVS